MITLFWHFSSKMITSIYQAIHLSILYVLIFKYLDPPTTGAAKRLLNTSEGFDLSILAVAFGSLLPALTSNRKQLETTGSWGVVVYITI